LSILVQFQGEGRGVCNFVGEVGNTDSQADPIRSMQVIDIGGNYGHVTDNRFATDQSTITASMAVQLQGLSLVVVAYTVLNNRGHLIEIVSWIRMNQYYFNYPL
jgi:hypothetical protein